MISETGKESLLPPRREEFAKMTILQSEISKLTTYNFNTERTI